MKCPDCGTRWNPPLRGRYVGTVLGANEKIGTVSADLPAGPPEVGGACLMTSKGCKSCYAQRLENTFHSENGLLGKHERAFAILRGNAGKYRDAVIGELRAYEARTGQSLDPVRIHAFGDFFSPEHVMAWVEIASEMTHIRFFGTTRMWQSFRAASGPMTKFREPLNVLRSMANVFLGASVDHGNRHKQMPAHAGGGTSVEWLHANGWTVWNALSEFASADLRNEVGAELFAGRQGETQEEIQAKAREQFKIAKKIGGMMVGIGCFEQSGRHPNCEACNHCLHKSDGTERWDVTFAFHEGLEKTVEKHGHRAVEV